MTARMLAAMGRLDKAEQRYRAGIAKAPTTSRNEQSTRTPRARFCSIRVKYDDDAECFRASLRAKSDFTGSLASLAEVQLRQGHDPQVALDLTGQARLTTKGDASAESIRMQGDDPPCEIESNSALGAGAVS